MTKDTSVAAKKDNLAEEFLRYLAIERNASPRTLKAYRQALGAFRGQNQKPWKQCRPDDFRNYLFAIMKRGQARSYVRLQFSALRAFYKFLADRKRLRIDPVRQLQLPKVEKKLPLVLTRQQIEELLSAPLRVAKQRAAPEWMPLRDVAVMELFYSSGLRLSELAALDVEDVDLYTESVRVFGKGRKERVCPVGVPALEAVQKYRSAANVHSHFDSNFDQSAQTSPQFCHPHARSRRGPAERAGIARPRQSFNDPNIHTRHSRALEESLRRGASTRLTSSRCHPERSEGSLIS